MSYTTIPPEVRHMFMKDANNILANEKKNLERRAAAKGILRFLSALEAAEAEIAQLRAQVSALLKLNEAVQELLDACLDEVEAISAHDDYQTGRTVSTETRLKNVRASLFAAYDKGTKAREKCETLGLTVTP